MPRTIHASRFRTRLRLCMKTRNLVGNLAFRKDSAADILKKTLLYSRTTVPGLVLELQCLCQRAPLHSKRVIDRSSNYVKTFLSRYLNEVHATITITQIDIFDIKILPTTDEIQSLRLEYLPTSDPTKHRLPSLAGLLDRQFRLLREDTVGQFRDAVQIECKRLTKPANTQSPPKRQNDGVRNIIYQNVALLRLEFDRKRGLQVVAELTNLLH